jgi:hypothetical protein
MERHATFCEDSICVVVPRPSSPRNKPRLYIAVWHACHPEICDACSLKADCDELFGERGKDCKIHRKGQRWVRLEDQQIDKLADLLKAE